MRRQARDMSILALGVWIAMGTAWGAHCGAASALPDPARAVGRRERATAPLFPAFFRSPSGGWQRPLGAAPDEAQRARKSFRQGLSSGRFFPAINLYRALLRAETSLPVREEALWHLAEGFQRMGHFYEAVSYWHRYLESASDPKSVVPAKAALAEALFAGRRFEEALALYREIQRDLQTRWERAWAIFRVGDCLMEMGRDGEAALQYSHARSIRPPLDWIPMESFDHLARMALEKGEIQEAKSFLMQALSLYPASRSRPEWMYLLAGALMQEGKSAESAWVLDRILKEHPRTEQARRSRVQLAALLVSGKTVPVGLSMGASYRDWMDPHHPIFHKNPADLDLQNAFLKLGRILMARHDRAGAFRLLGNGIRGFAPSEVTPRIAKTLLSLGRSLIHADAEALRFRKAIDRFQSVSRWVPGVWNDASILLDMGACYERLGFHGIAGSFYTRAAERASTWEAEWHATLGLMRVDPKPQHAATARALLVRLPVDSSWRQTASGLLAWACSTKTEEATRRVGTWLAEIKGGRLSAESVVDIAGWHLSRGDLMACADFLREALIGWIPQKGGLDHDPEAWSMLARVLERLEKPQEALACYAHVLSEKKQWGFAQKWAAYRAVKLGVDAGIPKRVLPYAQRLLKEPKGSLFRELIDSIWADVAVPAGKEKSSWS